MDDAINFGAPVDPARAGDRRALIERRSLASQASGEAVSEPGSVTQ